MMHEMTLSIADPSVATSTFTISPTRFRCKESQFTFTLFGSTTSNSNGEPKHHDTPSQC